MSKVLTIDRSIWLRGEENSMLYRQNDNKQCCIGIYLESCGMSKEDLMGVMTAGSLEDFERTLPEEAKWLEDDEIANMFYITNDHEKLSSFQRETVLKGAFKQQGITVKFEGRE